MKEKKYLGVRLTEEQTAYLEDFYKKNGIKKATVIKLLLTKFMKGDIKIDL